MRQQLLGARAERARLGRVDGDLGHYFTKYSGGARGRPGEGPGRWSCARCATARPTASCTSIPRSAARWARSPRACGARAAASAAASSPSSASNLVLHEGRSDLLTVTARRDASRAIRACARTAAALDTAARACDAVGAAVRHRRAASRASSTCSATSSRCSTPTPARADARQPARLPPQAPARRGPRAAARRVRLVRRARAPQRLLAAPPAASSARACEAGVVPARRGGARVPGRRLGRPLAETPAADERALRQAERAIAETLEHHAGVRWRAGRRPDRIAAWHAVATKWVYEFSEGSRDMRDLLGGKGANVAEMTRILGAERVPGGLHDHHRGVRRLHARRTASPTASTTQVDEALAALEEQRGQEARRRRGPAAGLGALGRARVDAGHARHRPQPRPQRRVGRRAWPSKTEQRALRLGLLPALRADVRQRRARHRGRALRGRDQARQGRPRRQATTPSSTSRRCASSRARFKELLRVPDRPARRSSSRRIRAVFDSWNGERAVDLPAHQPHPRRLGHRGQRPADGLRQQGRRQSGSRRRLQPRRGHRRARAQSGDFLINAQGEDVVSGVRNTLDIAELDRRACPRSTRS